jgi:subtilisin family serine protease
MGVTDSGRRDGTFVLAAVTLALAMVVASGSAPVSAAPRAPRGSFAGPGAPARLSSGARTASASHLASAGRAGFQFVPGEVVVGYKPGTSSATVRAARASVRGALRASVRRARTEVLALPKDATVATAIASLRADPSVAFAEPNYIRHLTLTPNDPLFGDEWGLSNTGQLDSDGNAGTPGDDVGAPAAWDITTGSPGITVAILDSGIANDHPDLAPNVFVNAAEIAGNSVDDDGNGFVDDVRGWDFVANDNDPRDYNGHGTHVAGTIGAAGNNSQGIAGVSWSSKLLPIRVADGDGVITSARLAEAFAYAGAMGARVANGSFGGGPASSAELAAIKAAGNTLFVFAAGNESANNDSTAEYPCDYGAQNFLPNVLCVGATDHNDALASFSNRGIDTVDLAAPGVEVASTWPAYGAPVFSDDFETDITGRWTATGTWARSTAHPRSGSSSLDDSPGATYPNDEVSSITTTNAINLAGRQGCQLDLWARTDLEANADFLDVQAAPAPGGPYSVLLEGTDTTGGAYSEGVASLEAFDGGPVYLRFELNTDSSVVDDGVYIDDVSVACLSGTYVGNEFQLDSGTSMAAPHVSGAAALLFAADPARTPAVVRSLLLTNVDRRAGLASTTLSGGRLDVGNAIAPNAPADLARPVASVNAFRTPYTLASTLGVGWSGSDAGTGVAVYSTLLRYANYRGAALGSYSTWRSFASASSASIRVSPGFTYCFAVRARDHAGNTSNASADRCEATPLGVRSMSASGFAARIGNGYYLRSYEDATRTGATLKLGNVRYRRLILVATTCPNCGSVEVLLGSTRLKTISLASPSLRPQQLFAITARTGVSPASTITIRTLSSKLVRIEGLGVSLL